MDTLLSAIFSLFKNISRNSYKTTYRFFTILIISFTFKYFYPNIFFLFLNQFKEYKKTIVLFIKFLTLAFFTYGNIETVFLLFYVLVVSLKALFYYVNRFNHYNTYKECWDDLIKDSYITIAVDKLTFAYSCAWIGFGYILLLNNNYVDLIKEFFNIITFKMSFLFTWVFIPISVVMFLVGYIPYFIKSFFLP
ncbi:hypothetical protein VTU32_06385 [Thermoanaerobacter sp. CM-CNRG TB177]|uniref:Uncharacterized protein n=2 Tax=Caldanaerobacter subterraneus TaxID=911092 RepID=Q8R898_CALS4|nr:MULTISPECIES: hypothetical protein [Thermoanaerobacteraceae]AAM25283.1 hypothetical protein TTE2116 [Caldanaerobacter subterraneus subsp. tengcongensis MB4]MBT1278925.1 hypothetical protein [Thermoanaerobacter sp. CM-CNRG TB177]MCS3915118.1 hypothetical protein [Caldanaerobacter subterraneus subsp. tengcongensis MB4]TCO55510.1 hypothetical protein EV203_13916 [Caldanaerobacter subterraneus]